MLGITSASTASYAFADFMNTGFELDFAAGGVALTCLALGFMLLVALVNFRGVSESVKANVVLTMVELSGLLLVIFVGLYAVTRATRTSTGWSCSRPPRTRACSSRCRRRPRWRSSRWSASRTR